MSENFTPSRRLTLADVSQSGAGLPNRCILHGPEGIGKTSFGCCAPKPIFLMSSGETGLLTLMDAGQVPDTPHFPEIATWEELLAVIEALENEQHDYRTLVLDTLNGAERLCHEHVCLRDFGGNWGNDGFCSYNRGFEMALADWRDLLQKLDELRARRRMSILALAHTKISTFKNPEGNDYDRYTVDLHQKTWGLTHKWADLVIFSNFVAHVDAKRTTDVKSKARGGNRRVLYTTHTAAHDAKNRHGLPEQIDAGNSAKEAWDNFSAALKNSKPQQQAPPADVQYADN
jgi:hypothetical protein